jgi:hypothetical protein
MSLLILDELRAMGLEVIPRGEYLAIRPAGKIPLELKKRLAEQKPEVLAALKAESSTASPRPETCGPKCYEPKPGYWIHRSRGGHLPGAWAA